MIIFQITMDRILKTIQRGVKVMTWLFQWQEMKVIWMLTSTFKKLFLSWTRFRR